MHSLRTLLAEYNAGLYIYT